MAYFSQTSIVEEEQDYSSTSENQSTNYKIEDFTKKVVLPKEDETGITKEDEEKFYEGVFKTNAL